jgi:hypothetical protein
VSLSVSSHGWEAVNASSMGMKKVQPRQLSRVSLSDSDEIRAAAFGVPMAAGSARGVLRVFISVSGYLSGCYSLHFPTSWSS